VVLGGGVTGTDGLSFEAGVTAAAPSASEDKTPLAEVPKLPRSATAAPSVPQAPPHAGGVAALTRAFARQQGQVARCFDTNAAELQGAPEIAIHFAVDPQGHVTSAQVLPPEVAPTPLGTCLASVARSTEFGPQAQGVSFRIPIVARRGP
jgi:hypothetical protein